MTDPNAVKHRVMELIWEALRHTASGHGSAPFMLVEGGCPESAMLMLSPELFKQLCDEAKLAGGAGAEESEQLLARFTS